MSYLIPELGSLLRFRQLGKVFKALLILSITILCFLLWYFLKDILSIPISGAVSLAAGILLYLLLAKIIRL